MKAGTYFSTDITLRMVRQNTEGWLYTGTPQRPKQWYYEDGWSTDHRYKLVKPNAKMDGVTLNGIPLSQKSWGLIEALARAV